LSFAITETSGLGCSKWETVPSDITEWFTGLSQ